MSRPLIDGPAIDVALAGARERYARVRPISAGHAAAAAKVLPGGSTRSVLNFEPFPFRVASADGATLVDVDGHRYLDLLGDYTAGLLGHNPPAVAEALQAAIERGWSMGAVGEADHRLAELVCGRFPSIERVRFTNSGTEANLMAVALARHHTGRSRVLGFAGGYHGGVLYFGQHGTPLRAPYDYSLCTFNDLDSVAAALGEHGEDTACILVEPMMGSGGCIPAEPGFLAGLRELCDASGALLIFDEVMTSRMAFGGVQAIAGVRPDLTTLGKYIGGGMTFGAFGGRADVLAAFDPAVGGSLTHPGTFNNNVMTMAAGIAAAESIITPDALDRLYADGEAFRAALGPVLAPAGLSTTGMGSLLAIHPVSGIVRTPGDLAGADHRPIELLFHGLLAEGIYIAARGFVALSLCVTGSDRERTIEIVADQVKQLVSDGLLTPESHGM
ncbi:MAG: aminotransferase class III-fold pyridoxal phosphate-dependent enzyme [Actinomycetota bacterium]